MPFLPSNGALLGSTDAVVAAVGQPPVRGRPSAAVSADPEDDPFASLEDAYGPATLVAAQIRAASGERADAEAALDDLAAGIFHQGSFFSATPPATKLLVRLAGQPVPA